MISNLGCAGFGGSDGTAIDRGGHADLLTTHLASSSMKAFASLCWLVVVHVARGHGDHGRAEGETIQQYAKRHVCKYNTTQTWLYSSAAAI
jgi:hypothetical protein